MKSVHDIEFKQYGRVLDVDTAEFVATMKAKEAIKEGVVYEPSDADWQKEMSVRLLLKVFKE